MKTEKLNEITKNINKNKPTYWLESIERIDWVKSFTKKQFLQLYNGYNIWVCGTLGGEWECEDFRMKNSNNKDWKFFYKVFKEYFETTDDEDEILEMNNLIMNSFENKEKVLNDYYVHKEGLKMKKELDKEMKKSGIVKLGN
tara:strand:- start:6416 stop:6841 length:426 start_codon:yes stop_codon:yes gene_type:complete